MEYKIDMMISNVLKLMPLLSLLLCYYLHQSWHLFLVNKYFL